MERMLYDPDYKGWCGVLSSVLIGPEAIPVWTSLPSVEARGFAHLLAYVGTTRSHFLHYL